MVIEINKDIDRYKESVALGLTARQLIFSIASVAVGGTLVFLLYPYIGLTGAAYVAIPVVAPIALGGFYSYNGMSFYEVMRKKFYFMFLNRILTYVSTEGESEIRALESEQNEITGKTGVFRFEKKTVHTEDGDIEKTSNQFEVEQVKRKMIKAVMVLIITIFLMAMFVALYRMGYLENVEQYIDRFFI